MSATAVTIPTGTWNLDPMHSKIGFSVKHMGISTVRGEFRTFEGSLTVAEDGSVTATGTIDANSVHTNQDDRDNHLRSPDFFDVEKFPQITFQSTGVSAVDDDEFEITGDLTIHGVTRPITLKAEVTGTETSPQGGDKVGLDVTGQLSRGDYDMKFNQALGSGNVMVSDKVKLILDIEADKA